MVGVGGKRSTERKEMRAETHGHGREFAKQEQVQEDVGGEVYGAGSEWKRLGVLWENSARANAVMSASLVWCFPWKSRVQREKGLKLVDRVIPGSGSGFGRVLYEHCGGEPQVLCCFSH